MCLRRCAPLRRLGTSSWSAARGGRGLRLSPLPDSDDGPGGLRVCPAEAAAPAPDSVVDPTMGPGWGHDARRPQPPRAALQLEVPSWRNGAQRRKHMRTWSSEGGPKDAPCRISLRRTTLGAFAGAGLTKLLAFKRWHYPPKLAECGLFKTRREAR